jgi:hypothetical protein
MLSGATEVCPPFIGVQDKPICTPYASLLNPTLLVVLDLKINSPQSMGFLNDKLSK